MLHRLRYRKGPLSALRAPLRRRVHRRRPEPRRAPPAPRLLPLPPFLPFPRLGDGAAFCVGSSDGVASAQSLFAAPMSPTSWVPGAEGSLIRGDPPQGPWCGPTARGEHSAETVLWLTSPAHDRTLS